jgi:hypothetical protein
MASLNAPAALRGQASAGGKAAEAERSQQAKMRAGVRVPALAGQPDWFAKS